MKWELQCEECEMGFREHNVFWAYVFEFHSVVVEPPAW